MQYSCKICDSFRCLSTTDLYLEIDRIKKRNISDPSLNLTKTKSCELYYAVEIGYVQMADLDRDALVIGLFDTDSSSYDTQLWQEAIDQQISPAESTRLICMKYFDHIWYTQLLFETSN